MIMRIIQLLSFAVIFTLSTAKAQDAASLRAAIESHYTAINSVESKDRGPEYLWTIQGQHLPDFTMFSGDGGLLWEAGILDAAKRMGVTIEFSTVKLSMRSFHAQIYGNAGMATFYLVGVVDGKPVTNRVSALWIYSEGKWREAHHHESPLIVPGVNE